MRREQTQHRNNVLLFYQLSVSALQPRKINRCRRQAGEVPGPLLVQFDLGAHIRCQNNRKGGRDGCRTALSGTSSVMLFKGARPNA